MLGCGYLEFSGNGRAAYSLKKNCTECQVDLKVYYLEPLQWENSHSMIIFKYSMKAYKAFSISLLKMQKQMLFLLPVIWTLNQSWCTDQKVTLVHHDPTVVFVAHFSMQLKYKVALVLNNFVLWAFQSTKCTVLAGFCLAVHFTLDFKHTHEASAVDVNGSPPPNESL